MIGWKSGLRSSALLGALLSFIAASFPHVKRHNRDGLGSVPYEEVLFFGNKKGTLPRGSRVPDLWSTGLPRGRSTRSGRETCTVRASSRRGTHAYG